MPSISNGRTPTCSTALYTRTRSYFDNSELAATGVPQGEELQILEPFRGQIPDEVFTKEYNPPKYDRQLHDPRRPARGASSC